MTIEEYIKSKQKFKLMPYATLYIAIVELIKDGFIEDNVFAKVGGANVGYEEPKSEWKVRW